jgi:DNA-binding LacI/PurR family transcriptional regulator
MLGESTMRRIGQGLVTLKDVAERAGVSVRTVSNVVNRVPTVGSELRLQVQSVLDEMGYEPNLAARSLRNGRSGLIGLVVPEIDMPYFAELTRALVDAFASTSFTLVVDHSQGSLERERDLISGGPRSALFDGLIFSPIAMSEKDLMDRRAKTPLVLLGEQVSATHDHVVIDNVAAGYEGTVHLLERGRRKIALIGDQRSAERRTSALRREGFEKALVERGLYLDPHLIPASRSFHREDGAGAVEEIWSTNLRFDAIFCMNDLLALGAIYALTRRGVRIPDDVAVIGVDDIEEGRFSNPTLSTVAPDKKRLAEVTVERLVARIKGDDSPPVSTTIPFAVLGRESTGSAA